MTLNTFHFAGVSEMNVTVGLPRIIEVLDGRQTIATPMMTIYLKPEYQKEVTSIVDKLRYTSFEEVIKEMYTDVVEKKLEIIIDKNKIKKKKLDKDKIIEKIKAKFKKKFSIKNSGEKLNISLLKQGKDGPNVSEIYKLKEKVKKLNISGIDNITQVLPVRRENEYVLITAGSNLKDIMKEPYVDKTRTTTNDIHEIQENLGIEAARQSIIREIYNVIENQGLNVDIRHIMLVTDTMTFTGKIEGITRFGIVSKKSSILAKASFETPIKHLITASLEGEKDELESVV